MIAAVTARAFDLAAGLAPAGVDVRRLPDGRDAAAFVLPDWKDRGQPREKQQRVVDRISQSRRSSTTAGRPQCRRKVRLIAQAKCGQAATGPTRATSGPVRAQPSARVVSR